MVESKCKSTFVAVVGKAWPPVNSIVDQDHTGHGQPEGEKRGEDGVWDVWIENTFRNSTHLLDVRLTGPG